MTIELSSDTRKTGEPVNLGTRAILEFMSGNHIEAVVERAVKSSESVSGSARRGLEQLIRESGFDIPGFRMRIPGSRLPRPDDPRLHALALKCAVEADDSLRIVLEVWAESHDRLRTDVASHLSDAGIAQNSIDHVECRFRGEWADDSVWLQARNRLASADISIDSEDVALMLCYVAGMLPRVSLYEDTGSAGHADDEYARVLQRLSELAVGAPEWDQALDFVTAANEIIDHRVSQRIRDLRDSLNATISSIQETFAEDLAYLELDLDSWSADGIPSPEDITRANAMAAAIESTLREYHVIRPQADVRSEELARAANRNEVEESLADLTADFERLLDDFEARDDELPDDSEGSDPTATDSYDENGADSSLGEDLDEVHSGLAIRETPGAYTLAALPDGEDSGETVRTLTIKNRRLASENAQLRTDIGKLKRQLKDKSDDHRRWVRNGRWNRYRATKRLMQETAPLPSPGQPANGVGEDEPDFGNVEDVVEHARIKLADRLRIDLNSHSSIHDNPFEKPDEVWSALNWLATVFHGTKTGRERVSDLDHSIREAIGWTYAPHQHDQTIARSPEAYTTVSEGAEHLLQHHLRKGSDRDSRHIIRIAFAWDRARDKVIVGYIGPHQPTRKS